MLRCQQQQHQQQQQHGQQQSVTTPVTTFISKGKHVHASVPWVQRFHEVPAISQWHCPRVLRQGKLPTQSSNRPKSERLRFDRVTSASMRACSAVRVSERVSEVGDRVTCSLSSDEGVELLFMDEAGLAVLGFICASRNSEKVRVIPAVL
jgi:hypothetical protein